MEKITAILRFITNLFKSVDSFSFRLLTKWVFLTCFIANLVASTPDFLISNPLIKVACCEYLASYKSLISDLKELIIAISTKRSQLDNDTTLQLLESLRMENIQRAEEYKTFTKNTLHAFQTINDTKISLLSSEIQRLHTLNLEATKDIKLLVMSNRESVEALYRANHTRNFSYMSSLLGVTNSTVFLLSLINKLFFGSPDFSAEAIDILRYLKAAADHGQPPSPDLNTPIFPPEVNISRRSQIN